MDSVECQSGQCVLTSCKDDVSCLEYCFNCYGTEKCFAVGTTCDYTKTLQLTNNGATRHYNHALFQMYLFSFGLTNIVYF
jgi:hypothetical protein